MRPHVPQPPPIRSDGDGGLWGRILVHPVGLASLASTVTAIGVLAGGWYGIVNYFETRDDAGARDRRWHTSAMWAQRDAAELRSLHFTVAARVCRLSKRDEESCTELDKQAQAAAARMGDIQRAIAAQSQ